jgi:hypothetical protein
MKLLAVDPGGKHVGLALFTDETCIKAWEETPADAIIFIREEVAELDVLVIEEFRLYPWMLDNQAWSDLPTCQLIGVLKYLHAVHGDASVKLVMQAATIKKPTARILRARRIVSQAKRSRAGGHAYDAELHGWHYLSNTNKKGTG